MTDSVNSTTEQALTVTALFKDRDSAERAYRRLIEHGYDRHSVNLVMSDETRQRFLASELIEDEHSTKGVAPGGVIGASSGALVGAMAGLAIPALGIVAIGPLFAALIGAGLGSLTGGYLGSLLGVGIPEEREQHYEEIISQGGVLMSVTARSESEAGTIKHEWSKLGGDPVAH
ncbi:MAG: hypothetical protein ACREBD_33865 [Blastocatellia bacterium]